MNMQKSLFRECDEFYSPDFEFIIDRRIVPNAGYNDSVHWHDYCEVEYVCSGRGSHLLNNQHCELSAGSVYIITPMDFHQVIPAPQEPLELYHIQFGCSVLDSRLMQRITRAQAMCRQGIASMLTGETRGMVLAGFEQLLEEFEAHNPDGILMMRSCLERLCILILRQAELGLPPGDHSVRTDNPGTVNEAVQYVKYNFRNQISLAEVAKHVHLSSNYFGELFHQSLGLSFNEYLRQCRLEYAHRLLVDTKLSVSEIAWESGFRTSSYFADVFRRRYGLSPTEFRRQILEKGMNTL